jgi:hypothetical protein
MKEEKDFKITTNPETNNISGEDVRTEQQQKEALQDLTTAEEIALMKRLIKN